MSDNKLTPDQLQALLQYASKRLGTTPEELQKTVSTQGVQSMASRFSPADAAKIQALVGDKDKLEQTLNSPQVQQFLEKFLGNK